MLSCFSPYFLLSIVVPTRRIATMHALSHTSTYCDIIILLLSRRFTLLYSTMCLKEILKITVKNSMTVPHAIHVYRASKEFPLHASATRDAHKIPLIFEHILHSFEGSRAAQQTIKSTNMMATRGTYMVMRWRH